jgi:hypothetical protein
MLKTHTWLGQHVEIVEINIRAIIFRVSLLKYIDMFLMIGYLRIIPKF